MRQGLCLFRDPIYDPLVGQNILEQILQKIYKLIVLEIQRSRFEINSYTSLLNMLKTPYYIHMKLNENVIFFHGMTITCAVIYSFLDLVFMMTCRGRKITPAVHYVSPYRLEAGIFSPQGLT